MYTIKELSIMTTNSQVSLARPTMIAFVRKRIIKTINWPFTHRYSAPIWLALRLYIGWIWFQMSIGKFAAGWLSSDPTGAILKQVANGNMPVPFAFYRDVAAFLVSSGATVPLSHAMPFLEMAVALAFFSGVLVRPAAIGGLLLLANIALTGMATLMFDGQVALAHGLLILAGSVAGLIGFERLAARILNYLIGLVRSALPVPQRQLALQPVRVVRQRRK
jgi:thiosulfate dehydrogenase (quinone) large subunit